MWPLIVDGGYMCFGKKLWCMLLKHDNVKNWIIAARKQICFCWSVPQRCIPNPDWNFNGSDSIQRCNFFAVSKNRNKMQEFLIICEVPELERNFGVRVVPSCADNVRNDLQCDDIYSTDNDMLSIYGPGDDLNCVRNKNRNKKLIRVLSLRSISTLRTNERATWLVEELSGFTMVHQALQGSYRKDVATMS